MSLMTDKTAFHWKIKGSYKPTWNMKKHLDSPFCYALCSTNKAHPTPPPPPKFSLMCTACIYKVYTDVSCKTLFFSISSVNLFTLRGNYRDM